MDLKAALERASSAIELAEQTADDSSRKEYLKLARYYLARADVDGWFGRKRPAVILALEEELALAS